MKLAGTFATGKFSAAFNTAKAVFDGVKKPEIQHRLIAASRNETVRSVISSLAKNETVSIGEIAFKNKGRVR